MSHAFISSQLDYWTSVFPGPSSVSPDHYLKTVEQGQQDDSNQTILYSLHWVGFVLRFLHGQAAVNIYELLHSSITSRSLGSSDQVLLVESCTLNWKQNVILPLKWSLTVEHPSNSVDAFKKQTADVQSLSFLVLFRVCNFVAHVSLFTLLAVFDDLTFGFILLVKLCVTLLCGAKGLGVNVSA